MRKPLGHYQVTSCHLLSPKTKFMAIMRRVDSLEKTLMLGGIGTGGEVDDRGWDGWMASPSLCTRVWVNSGSWWWTGRPGVLWFMGSQRVGHDWVAKLNWGYLFEVLLFPFLPLDENPSGINFNLVFRMVKFVFQPVEIRPTEGQQTGERMLNITDY